MDENVLQIPAQHTSVRLNVSQSPVLSNDRNDTTTGSRLEFLDSFRGIAALWVLVSHLWIFQFGMNAQTGVLGWATNWLIYSHLAVDVFIVLSGYCLILPVLRQGSLKGGAAHFYLRRCRRILPPLYAALLLGVLGSLWRTWADTRHWHISCPALCANLFLLQDVFALRWNYYDSPLWSVAVEWKIYFLFPLLVALLIRWGRGAVLTVSCVASVLITGLIVHRFPDAFMVSPWYFGLFGMGICAASVAVEKPSLQWSPIRLALLFGAVALEMIREHPVTALDGSDFGRHMPQIDTMVGAAAALTLLVLHVGGNNRRIRVIHQLLSWQPLIKLGGYSYSVYLTHVPITLILLRLLDYNPAWAAMSPSLHFAISFAFGIPIVLAFAYRFYVIFERPFIGSVRINR